MRMLADCPMAGHERGYGMAVGNALNLSADEVLVYHAFGA
ncbi:hypothetical protein ABIA39_002230 [Nocardia sp. GAS34]